MKNDRVLSALGLAMKAGAVVSGEFAVEKAVKTGMAWMVIVATDASDNTKKKMGNMTDYYEVEMYEYGIKENLGRAIGKEYRSMLAITQEGFVKSIKKQLNCMGIKTE